MPYQINYLQNGIGIELLVSGVITGKEVIEANKIIYSKENLQRLRYKLVDRTNCAETKVTSEEMENIAMQTIEAAKINKDFLMFPSKRLLNKFPH